ncbi:hypothetical protein JGU71_20985 [Antrihabitans sp. YC3-6]|uniref:Uncharacterized protein n=1 Tax=Antrihabitans stalagmiti TaxID=2799499 RepID=A0A934NU63_9NOCA|nr:hypothetical protein [Antrihabitans stalagmiti]MBJ8341365.1 hypothetical protein [Antrihabitans stalagmiti]
MDPLLLVVLIVAASLLVVGSMAVSVRRSRRVRRDTVIDGAVIEVATEYEFFGRILSALVRVIE